MAAARGGLKRLAQGSALGGAVVVAFATFVGVLTDQGNPEFLKGLDRELNDHLSVTAIPDEGLCYMKESGRERVVSFTPAPEGGFNRGFRGMMPLMDIGHEQPVEVVRLPLIHTGPCAELKDSAKLTPEQAADTAREAYRKALGEAVPSIKRYRGMDGHFDTQIVPVAAPGVS